MPAHIALDSPSASFWQRNQKACIGSVAALALVIIGLTIAQKTGAIDMVKFGQTKTGVITYSIIGGIVGAVSLGALGMYFKNKSISNTELAEYQQIIQAAPKIYTDEQRLAAIMGVHLVEILPGLLLANEAAVGLDNQEARTRLKEENVTDILCCLPEAPGQIEEERRTHFYFPNDFNYQRMPIGDAAKNAQEFLKLLPDALQFIESARQNNRKVVVHCNAGNSRSPSVVIAYLMWKYKCSFEQAHNYVNQKRWVQVDNFRPVLTTENLHNLQVNVNPSHSNQMELGTEECPLGTPGPDGKRATDVIVQTHTGKSITFKSYPETTTVEALKKALEARTGQPSDKMRLLFAGRQWEDHRTLADYCFSTELKTKYKITMHLFQSQDDGGKF